jgi:aerobic C4-dicarboxylate transport protein
MKAAPIGAFGAMAFTIGKYGIGSVANLALLIGTFYITRFLFVFVVLGAVAVTTASPFSHLSATSRKNCCSFSAPPLRGRAAGPDEKMEKAGCKRSVVGLVIPTGYSSTSTAPTST